MQKALLQAETSAKVLAMTDAVAQRITQLVDDINVMITRIMC